MKSSKTPLQSTNYRFQKIFILIGVVLFFGCAKKGSEVKGYVLYNGRPVYPGSVIFIPETGKTLSANLNDKGEFILHGVKQKKYKVAIQTQKLGGIKLEEAQTPGLRREDAVPDKFKNLNADIPAKYGSAKTSGLEV